MSTLIRGGTVVTAEGEARVDVLVVGETIAAVGPGLDAPAGARIIDAGGAYVIPGGIDPHTHMDMPFGGTTSADDFESLATDLSVPVRTMMSKPPESNSGFWRSRNDSVGSFRPRMGISRVRRSPTGRHHRRHRSGGSCGRC